MLRNVGFGVLRKKASKQTPTKSTDRLFSKAFAKVFRQEKAKKKSRRLPADVDDVGAEVGGYKVEVLDIVKRLPAEGFERLCQRLLRESGFQQVVVTGRSGDGGIDGIGTLQINPFVSFSVLFQCKRYQVAVTPSQVRDFRGAMMGRADKGIIMTTGTFTVEAKREARRDGVPPIELVDGENLIQMFEQLQLGLQPKATYEVDDGFFEEFRK